MDSRKQNIRGVLVGMKVDYWAGVGLRPYEPPPVETVRFAPAPLFARFVARLFDLCFFIGAFFSEWFIATLFDSAAPSFRELFVPLILGQGVPKAGMGTSYLFLLLGTFSLYLYFILIPSKTGATLGKHLMRLEILSREGELTQTQLILREIIGNWLVGVLTRGVLLVWPGLRDDHRSIGDLLANTEIKRPIKRRNH